MDMTNDEMLNIVALKFCNGCSWLNPLWLENGPHGCQNKHCPYKKTYLELEKHLDQASKEVEEPKPKPNRIFGERTFKKYNENYDENYKDGDFSDGR